MSERIHAPLQAAGAEHLRRPIRVLQLGSPEGMFGAERWIMALATALPARQVDTVIGVLDDRHHATRPPLCEHAARAGLETVTIRAPGRFNREAIRALRSVILERRIDVLHTHFYKSTIAGVLAASGTSCRVLATPHGWSVDAGPKLAAYEWLERLFFAGADTVAPLSADLLRDLQRLPWLRRRLVLVENGVDLGEVDAASRVAGPVEHARARGEFVVGYIGQLIPRKRVDVLLRAFARLTIPKRRLFVVGEGPERDALLRLAASLGVSELVRFEGFREDRLDYLRGFDVLALPSALEGIPRCLMEAMAARVAVVASDIPGTRDIVQHGRTGLLHALDDVEGLAAALERTAAGGASVGALVDAAERRVRERFSSRAMADRYLELYRGLRPASAGEGGASDQPFTDPDPSR